MDANSFTIRGILASAFRNKWKIAAFNLMVCLAVLAIILFLPRTYRSEAKILVKVGRENSKLDPAVTTGERIAIQDADREDDIVSAMDLLSSWSIAALTVDTLTPPVVLGNAPLPAEDGEAVAPPDKNPIMGRLLSSIGQVAGAIKSIDPVDDREKAIRLVLQSMEMEVQPKSNVISIRYDAEYPKLAQAVLQQLLTHHLGEHARIHHEEDSQGFFEQQRDSLRNLVAEAAQKHQATLDNLGIASVDGLRRSLEDGVMRVRNSRLSTLQSYTEAKAKRDELDKSVAATPAIVESQERTVPNTGRDSLRARLYELQVARIGTETLYQEDHPRYQATKTLEDNARATLESESEETRVEKTKSINANHQSLSLELEQTEAQLAGYRAILQELDEQESSLREQIRELNAAAVEVRRLERELAMAEQNYAKYSESLEVARIDDELSRTSISNINIPQQPNLQQKPVSPSKLLAIICGLFLMISGTVAIATAAEFLDSDTVRESDDVLKIDRIPLLASIPKHRRYSRILS